MEYIVLNPKNNQVDDISYNCFDYCPRDYNVCGQFYPGGGGGGLPPIYINGCPDFGLLLDNDI